MTEAVHQALTFAALVALLALGWLIANRANPRKAVERWLAAETDGAVSVAVITGAAKHDQLPRNVDIYSPSYLASEGCLFLNQRGPSVLVLDRPSLQEGFETVLESFDNGEFNYNFAFQRGPLAVFRRADRPCLDSTSLKPALAALRDSRDHELRRILAHAIRQHAVPDRITLGGDRGEILGLGLRFDRWSRGSQPVAIVFHNNQKESRVPSLVLGCLATRLDRPVMVTVDDGTEQQERVFNRPGKQVVRLKPMRPGETRLVLVWSDKSWQPAGLDKRLLGVAVHEASLSPVEDSG